MATSGGVSDLWLAGYDGINPTLALSSLSSSAVTNRYLWGPGVDFLLADEQLSPAASPTAPVTAGNTLWPLGDHLGTLRDLADFSGTAFTITNHRVFDTFGRLTSESNSTVDSHFAFTGKFFDDLGDTELSTSLSHHWNRWYDPQLGKWLSEDPIGFAGGDVNLGRYVGNGVLTKVDPNGLAELEVIYGSSPIPGKNLGIKLPNGGTYWASSPMTPEDWLIINYVIDNPSSPLPGAKELLDFADRRWSPPSLSAPDRHAPSIRGLTRDELLRNPEFAARSSFGEKWDDEYSELSVAVARGWASASELCRLNQMESQLDNAILVGRWNHADAAWRAFSPESPSSLSSLILLLPAPSPGRASRTVARPASKPINYGVLWNNGWRTVDGKFASPRNAIRSGAAEESFVWDAVEAKPGWQVIRGEVSVRNAAGQLRKYDGAAISPKGRVIGLEVKSGNATRKASQRAFDSFLNSSGVETLPTVGKHSGRQIRRSIEIRPK